jgi:hypothetical protein
MSQKAFAHLIVLTGVRLWWLIRDYASYYYAGGIEESVPRHEWQDPMQPTASFRSRHGYTGRMAFVQPNSSLPILRASQTVQN